MATALVCDGRFEVRWTETCDGRIISGITQLIADTGDLIESPVPVNPQSATWAATKTSLKNCLAASGGGAVITVIKEEIYRLDSTTSATATAASYENPSATPTLGNTVTINDTAGAIKGISARWMRGTEQDTGDGSIAKCKIGPFDYFAGSGDIYSEVFWSVTTANNEKLSGPFVFTVSGTAGYVEIIVLREE